MPGLRVALERFQELEPPVAMTEIRDHRDELRDVTPVPPAVTSKPRDHPVASTWKAFLELERIRA